MSWNKIFNPISKRYVNLNSKKGLEIMNNYLGHYRVTHTGGGNTDPDWVFDMGDDIVKAFLSGLTWIYSSKKKKQRWNFRKTIL